MRQMRFKVYPSKTQLEVLETWNQLHCELYNACLQERRDAYRKAGKTVGYLEQQNQLPEVKKARPEFKLLGSQALQETVRRVDRAFQALFRRVQRGETPGYPRFKSSRSYVGFTYPAKAGWKFELGENGKHGKLHITHLGTLKVRGKPRQWGEPRRLTLSKVAGQWYVTLTVRCMVSREAGSLQAGMDLGTTHLLSLSDGTQVQNPRFLKKAARRMATLNRELSRRKLFGKNWRRTKLKLSRLSARVTSQRADFQHKLSASLVSTYGLLVTEELNIKGMTHHGGVHKKGLNRAILDVGMGGLLQKLQSKVNETGSGRLWFIPTVEVKPSQTCPVCGHQEKKPLAQRTHHCLRCDHTEDRDVAAAQVMPNWALDHRQELAGGDAGFLTAEEPRSPDQTALASGVGHSLE